MRQTILLAVCILGVLLPADAQDKKKATPKEEPGILLSVPLGTVPGKTAKFTLRGRQLDQSSGVRIVAGKAKVKILGKGKANVPDKNPEKVGDTQIEIELEVAADTPDDVVAVTITTPAGETKPHEILIERKFPVIAEKDANEGFRSAQAVSVPTLIDGSIGRPKDVDVFRIEGKKGQKLYAETLASRHGSPLDAILTLYDAKGESLAVSDDFAKEHHDARIEIVLPADGNYYLSLIDAHDTGSNLHVYRLLIR